MEPRTCGQERRAHNAAEVASESRGLVKQELEKLNVDYRDVDDRHEITPIVPNATDNEARKSGFLRNCMTLRGWRQIPEGPATAAVQTMASEPVA